ncbi:hypothetical protein [Actinoplanes sp. NPDC051859]|uniref:hypothetical protein n=1 Tax=Actinoplanes sp. NPDC051859 TaxID=3363909 RepID=UPI0037BBD2F8
MDGHRRYDEELEPSWYAERRAEREATPWDRPSGAFRLPEQRPAEYPPPDRLTPLPGQEQAGSAVDSGSIRLPVRGPEYPAVRPSSASPSVAPFGERPMPPPAPPTFDATPRAEGATYGRTSQIPTTEPTPTPSSEPPAAAPAVPDHPGRPVSATIFALVTAVLFVPAALLLFRSAFTGDSTARDVVPAVLLTLGLPLTGYGVFSLTSGSWENWSRAPLAYLPVGLVLLLAAGLAVA